ncbi:MAG: hypothetical protein H7Y17_16275 [Chlorobia bacterium]|nr:hypothetical protein [Fimbriimonadaceae bacterium]
MRLPEAFTIPNAETTFCGFPAAQTWHDLAIWEEFFNRHRFETLIELGTWKGGMAVFLAIQCKARGIRFETIDHDAAQVEPRDLIDSLGAAVLSGNVFDLTWMKERIRAAPGPRLLFCDDGDKRREMRELAPLLDAGDFVAVHDWGSEAGSQDIPAAWEPIMAEVCESTSSITRFFRLPILSMMD